MIPGRTPEGTNARPRLQGAWGKPAGNLDILFPIRAPQIRIGLDRGMCLPGVLRSFKFLTASYQLGGDPGSEHTQTGEGKRLLHAHKGRSKHVQEVGYSTQERGDERVGAG